MTFISDEQIEAIRKSCDKAEAAVQDMRAQYAIRERECRDCWKIIRALRKELTDCAGYQSLAVGLIERKALDAK